MRGIAINIGANTNLPGFRGPVWADGTFEYIPIPEREQTRERVPTYGDLAGHLETTVPEDLWNTPVHLDPEFAEYPLCERYTYGDDHGVKAGPLSSLSAGDYVFFYATLSVVDGADWLPPSWGAFVIGHFRLATDPITGDQYDALDASERERYATNAHTKRDPVDGSVYLLGDSDSSHLYERVVPLNTPDGGTNAGWPVTDLSADSGRGPWWRRPLRFDDESTERLLELTTVEPEHVVNRG